jgi:hypothetical protein
MRQSRLILVAALGLLALAGPAVGHAVTPKHIRSLRVSVEAGGAVRGGYSIRLHRGKLFAAYWRRWGGRGRMAPWLSAWDLRGGRAKRSIRLAVALLPVNGIAASAELNGPQAGRLLFDASPTVNRVWVIGLAPLRVEKILPTGLPENNPWALIGFARGGSVARYTRCTNAPPQPEVWTGKGPMPPPPPPPPPQFAPPPYTCGPVVLRDVPLAPGLKPRQWSLDLHLPPSELGGPIPGPGGGLWFSQYGPMGPEPGAKVGPIFVEYDADTGRRLRTVADPSSVTPAPQPLAGGAMLDAAAVGLPGRRGWGSRLVLYPPGDVRPRRGAFFEGCNFTNFDVSADGQYAAGLCSALTRHMFFGIDFYGVSKSIAVFFQVPDLKVINVVRLNKGFDGADAAVERQGDWLVEAIADNPGHIRILRVPLPQAAGGKVAGKPEGR